MREGREWEIRVRVLGREKRLNWRRIHGVPEFAVNNSQLRDRKRVPLLFFSSNYQLI